jgi:hypothetical protein
MEMRVRGIRLKANTLFCTEARRKMQRNAKMHLIQNVFLGCYLRASVRNNVLKNYALEPEGNEV